MAYECEECGAGFQKLSQLLQHRRTLNHHKKYMCTQCKKVFNRKSNLDRHQQKHDSKHSHHCPDCLKAFMSDEALTRHMLQNHNQFGGAAKRTLTEQDDNLEHKRQKLQTEDGVHFVMNKVSERKIEKFRTTASYFKIYVEDTEVKDLPNILKYLKTLFQSIIERMTGDIPSTDLVRISMDNPELDYPIVLPFMRRSDLTVERVLAEIERVLQSYEQFVIDETFGIELVHVQAVSGSGYKMKPVVDITKMLDMKKSIIQIKNKDDMCCARAIVTAIARHEKHQQWNNIRQGRYIQRKLAEELHEKVNVQKQTCTIDDVKTFQSVLPDYQIHVLSKEYFNAIIYSGPDGGIPIYLYHHDGHFDVITTMTGFLKRSYYCMECKKGYDHKERHSCNNPCQYCRHLHTDKEDDWRHCDLCDCKFINQICFNLHLQKTEKGKSTCELYYKCQDCGQLINRSMHKHAHVCGETYCKTCKEYVSEDHQCFMQTVEDEITDAKAKPKELKYIFFDFECTQDTQLQCDDGYTPDEQGKCTHCKRSICGSFEHQPNLCVLHKVCEKCIHGTITPDSICDRCGRNERIFQGSKTTTDFCNWLFSEENIGATVVCHNFKGYDSYPILRFLHDNAILPDVITNGTKFMSIKVAVRKIRFIDSLNFIPMALAGMPEAFGETELAKGYFPHLFNRQENQTVILPELPAIKYYNPDEMKPKTREKFTTWYKNRKNQKFDFQDELLKYCRSDVDILRKCCLKFRTLFQNISRNGQGVGVDPFEKCVTIASACNLVFRRNFLNPESIGIIPSHGYRPEAKQSTLAYRWLAYESYTKGITIQHGRNNGEKQIGQYKVDGFYEKDREKVVLEFNGCFWHGCPKCFSKTSVNPVCDATMSELYDRTIAKKQYIEELGFTYIAMWECEFKKQLENNAVMRSYIESLDIVSPLEPRDAFYGGRTEGFKLYEEGSCDLSIDYYDVTSLYPFINKTGKIPMGHPEIITEHFKDIQEYEGLIKCKVEAPRGLYLPVLPVKSNGKLVFSLCKSCADSYQQSVCQHAPKERAFTGTWATDELKMALTQGYKILQIYEVWHFTDISQYDPDTKSGGVFTEYVNTFLKIKQEASGWPKWCQSEDDKQLYIKQFYEKEGICLEYSNIEKNPGLRSLAKLMLNSFWGKFGQRTNLTQSSYMKDPNEFFDMMTSDQQVVKNVRFVNDESVQVDWVYREDFVEPAGRTNVVIAAYTTAQARLKLYSYLQKLGERVLYCDTDSVIFTTRRGEWKPPLGDYLGDLTDEVPGNTITHFVTGGPKNYAYKTENCDKDGNSSFCKVKGITMNFKNSLKINFDTVASLVKENMNSTVPVADTKICRDLSNTTLFTRKETKDYRVVFDKRVICKKVLTYPYGY